jgi:hypothetical protein
MKCAGYGFGEGTTAADNMELFEKEYNASVVQTLIHGNWAKFHVNSMRATLLLTGTTILVEACPKGCDCMCGIGCGSTGDWTSKKVKKTWKDNLLGKTLMAIRHAFFVEERTGVLTTEDVLDAWDWRDHTKDCVPCGLTLENTQPWAYPQPFATRAPRTLISTICQDLMVVADTSTRASCF